MVEPISITALIIAVISGLGVIIKSITDSVNKSSCMSEKTVSSSGSTRTVRRFQGNHDPDHHRDSNSEQSY